MWRRSSGAKRYATNEQKNHILLEKCIIYRLIFIEQLVTFQTGISNTDTLCLSNHSWYLGSAMQNLVIKRKSESQQSVWLHRNMNSVPEDKMCVKIKKQKHTEHWEVLYVYFFNYCKSYLECIYVDIFLLPNHWT